VNINNFKKRLNNQCDGNYHFTQLYKQLARIIFPFFQALWYQNFIYLLINNKNIKFKKNIFSYSGFYFLPVLFFHQNTSDHFTVKMFPGQQNTAMHVMLNLLF